ncbi:uncharacterized protein LOC106470798 isoform X1 [Limulus polyphemus]|uniref:Uncharacterized protein LOC106470798 isoform X1 n=1 Tax=Limulus polyphemus TaxID=6850 RepID=A0ABM1TGZ4_LIMPO|nr:uncharacterized protein LOC106470798 isoform X1 [Limulus polyphemus]
MDGITCLSDKKTQVQILVPANTHTHSPSQNLPEVYQMKEMNQEKPEKSKELRECIGQFFNGKPKWLHGAIQECKNEKFPSEKFDKYLTEMCTEEREADLQDVKECIGEQFAAAQVDQETSYTEIINKCF